jgi:hypothetical protein
MLPANQTRFESPGQSRRRPGFNPRMKVAEQARASPRFSAASSGIAV